MKELKFHRSQAGVLTRLIAAFCLLLVAFGANASSGDDMCFALYAKSGAVQGSKFCRLDVASNTPGGMGNYACINDTSLIDRWCATPCCLDPLCGRDRYPSFDDCLAWQPARICL